MPRGRQRSASPRPLRKTRDKIFNDRAENVAFVVVAPRTRSGRKEKRRETRPPECNYELITNLHNDPPALLRFSNRNFSKPDINFSTRYCVSPFCCGFLLLFSFGFNYSRFNNLPRNEPFSFNFARPTRRDQYSTGAHTL